MSVSMWSYRPEVCDGGGCPGDCDLCDKPKNMEDEDDTADYIKRDAVIDYLDSNNMPWRDWVKDIPSADVVEVVRCKDCKHKIEDDYSDGNVPDLICKEWDSGVDINDYCSYGKRREE